MKYGTYCGNPLEEHSKEELCEIIMRLSESNRQLGEFYYDNKLLQINNKSI